MNKNIIKSIKTTCLAVPVILCGCNFNLNLEEDAFAENNARVITDNNSDWEQFDDKEIDAAKKAAPKNETKMAKVICFDGALTKLSKIGAKKLTADMESDAGVAFVDFTENVLSGCLKFADGILDNYTFGIYKAVSGILFPDEAKPDLQIEKLQQCVDKIQDSVDDVKFELSNLSSDLKYEFDGQKVANRVQEIERQKAAFDKMFNYLKYCNQNGKEVDLMAYYELKKYAIEAFGSVDKMRQAIQNFYTSYYKGDAVATRSYGESYRLIGEELFPWRYQTADFMETLIGQELDFSTRLFILAGIMLDPNDNMNLLLDMMIQETMNNSVDADRLEKLIKMNASAGRNQNEAVFNEIMEILGRYWVIIPTYHWNVKEGEEWDINKTEVIRDENVIDDVERNRLELLERECKVANDAWDNLVKSFYEYEQTIETIQIPVDKENEITCNIRGIKCTFSQTINQFNYSEKLSKLADCSVKDKTEANWLKIYKTGCCPSEKPNGYVRMLSSEDYGRILDFYKKNNLVITDSKVCDILSEKREIVGRCKKTGGNELEATLYNIFRYEAGFNFQSVEASKAKFACLNPKEPMGFILENERTDYGFEFLSWNYGRCFDGLHYWNVKVPAVNGNKSSLECKNELLLEDMAARKGDKSKINRIKYFNDSKVSETKYLIPNIITNF